MTDAGMKMNVQTFGGDQTDARRWPSALWRGLRKRCPECGLGPIFSGYTRTHQSCPHCGLAISGHRADDAPPYLTIFAVGHLIIPLALAVKQLFDPPLGLQFAIWLPAIAILSGLLLPISKGAMIALQWANRMHGFAGADADPEADA